MNNIKRMYLLASIFVFSTITLWGQKNFQREQSIPDGKCVIYVFRESSITGAAVSQYGVQVAKAGKVSFPKPKTKGIYYTYTKLRQGSFAPIFLDANTTYRLILEGSGVPVYFSGEAGSETIIGISGTSYPKYDCIKGASYIIRKTFIKQDFESDILSGKAKLEKLKEKPTTKLMKKLEKMELSVDIGKYIYN